MKGEGSRFLLTYTVLLITLGFSIHRGTSADICVVGGGVGGASAAFFIQNGTSKAQNIKVFELRQDAGGRASLISFFGDSFEAGASIIHESNHHLVKFAEFLGLNRTRQPDGTVGIWSGTEVLYRDLVFGDNAVTKWLADFLNSARLILRYGYQDLRALNSFVSNLLTKWEGLYSPDKPSFHTVEHLLKSLGLFELTQTTLSDVLKSKNLSLKTIDELITMVLRVNYGQDSHISALAGAVGLAGTGGQLWAVEGGNNRIPLGLLEASGATFLGNHRVQSVERQASGGYRLTVETSLSEINPKPSVQEFFCDAVVLAVPLEEGNITIVPQIDLPRRRYQQTVVTFVRGKLNASYFGLEDGSVPSLIGTIEDPSIPFSSISILKKYSESDMAYKIFSREKLWEDTLDDLFQWRNDTVSIRWSAYPAYRPPEMFAPFLLDDENLYYVNTFESAASAMETAALAAQNVARLLLERLKLRGVEEPCGKDNEGSDSASGNSWKADL